MRKPQPPPTVDLAALLRDPARIDFSKQLLAAIVTPDRYLPWDELRNRRPPDGLTVEEWWAALKVRRAAMRRSLPLLLDNEGRPFGYALHDDVLRGIEVVDKQTSGRVSVPTPVLPEAPTRERYVINSLIEEAITSSQLEGAATTRKVAKDMLRTGRKPRTRDERMILNNYMGMLRVRELRHERLSPAMVTEFHRIITKGTLDEPADCGRLQLPGEDRVAVEDHQGEVMHSPPPARQLPERLERLCRFANGDQDTAYVPPVVRAILLHFMLAYDHPFADGNGRTARLLFYWSMLSQDYWLAEFLPISRLLKKAPAQYARSFLHSEQDDGDLTYFVLYQLRIAQRAIADLHDYLDRKAAEAQQVRQALRAASHRFNPRQLALLENALKHSDAHYTVASHSRSQGVVAQTARCDLHDLEEQGFLVRTTAGRGHAWTPSADLERRLKTGS